MVKHDRETQASFFFQAEDGIRAGHVTGVQTCALPIFRMPVPYRSWANKRCSPSRKPRMRTTSSGVSTTGKRRDGREIGRASCRERVKSQEGEGAVSKKTRRNRKGVDTTGWKRGD